MAVQILRNKLGSNAEVDLSDVGVNGVRTGAVIYAACEFDDGVDDCNVARFVTFPAGNTSSNLFEMWFWWKPHYNSATPNVYDLVGMNSGGGEWFEAWWWGPGNLLEIYFYEGVYNSRYRWSSGILNFIVDQKMSVAIKCDPTAGVGDKIKLYIDKIRILPDTILNDNAWNFGNKDVLIKRINGDLNAVDDNIIIWDDVDADINGIDYEDGVVPAPVLPAIEETDLVVKRPRVLVLNSEIDLYDLGYVTKMGKIQEKKTFQRDKVTMNQMVIPVHNIDNQFNPDNPDSIFAGINWRYQPVKAYDEDDNKIWDGLIDDFKDDQNGKKTGLVSKDSLLNFYKTHIEYVSDDWETPGDAFKNICDKYGYTNYNSKYLEDSIAQYTANNCFIKCNFKLSEVTFQQAIEKIAKVGAADCYSANNLLNYKLWIPFSGGVKFNLVESDLRKNIKSHLSRVYYNNYIINYFGDVGVAAIDEDNNNIGEISRNKNGPQDIVLDGSDNQQIIIKDLVSAIFLGEQHIRRTHVNLLTVPFPPLIITFSLSYDHKDFINLQTWFRLTHVSKGWTDKLFEVYINNIDYSGRFLDLTAYEVEESG